MAETTPLKIGASSIGEGFRTYVIAEAGVNHNGSLATALRLVDAAVEAGADAVKFQMFRAAELTCASAATADYQRSSRARTQRELLEALELSDQDFARIRGHCVDVGIEWLVTPFGLHDVERLSALGVRAFKIASTDLNNAPLQRAIAKRGLPMIVSTGAALEQEIADALDSLAAQEALGRLILLHCVSSYPTPLEAANLRRIAALHERFGVRCGFSDHTDSTRTGALAVAASACVLEKHITLDRSLPGPDQAFSLDPSMFQAYVSAVREAEQALGSGQLDMNPIESDVRAVARKSVVAAERIPAGTRIGPHMLTLKRPGDGIPPDRLAAVVGRVSAVEIPADTLIAWDMVR